MVTMNLTPTPLKGFIYPSIELVSKLLVEGAVKGQDFDSVKGQFGVEVHRVERLNKVINQRLHPTRIFVVKCVLYRASVTSRSRHNEVHQPREMTSKSVECQF